MKKIAKITTALLAANLCFPYYTVGDNYAAIAEGTDDITVYSLLPAKDGVEDFYAMLDNADINGVYVKDRALLNDEENCYRIRTIPENPNGTSIEDLWMLLYKDSNTGAAHLVFDDKVVRFIGNEGGLGVTSLALGDLNNDSAYEIYFTYSWNAGTYCSQAGYFDTKTSEVHYFGDYMCPDSELIFTSENDTLTVCKAELTEYKDKVHFGLGADKGIAEIVCNNGEIGIDTLSDDFVKLEEKLEPTEKPLPDWLPKSADEAETFMNENGAASVGMADTTTVVKDEMICSIIYINGADSTRSDKICLSERSDVKAPISYKKYRDQYSGEYIVACFEMPSDSYLEIYDKRYYPEILGTYISDENGEICEACKGDANKDGELNIADLVILQRWLLGKDDDLGCWQLADICDDNRIDGFDMVMLRKLLIEK